MSRSVPEVKPQSWNDINEIAYREVERFAPQLLTIPAPFPVEAYFDRILFKYEWIQPGVADLGEGYEGICTPDGRVLISNGTYEALQKNDGRARFTVAHECYHGICHSRQIKSQLVESRLSLKRRGQIKPFRDPEWQANVFASALLMPAPSVASLKASIGPGFDATDMMETFLVSYEAANVRYEQLKSKRMI
jgi:hypothetical protein